MDERGYTCWKISSNQRINLLSWMLHTNFYFASVFLEGNWKTYCDHITHEYDVPKPKYGLGKDTKFMVGSPEISDRVIAAPVYLLAGDGVVWERPDGKYYHLTIATNNDADNARPVESNDLLHDRHRGNFIKPNVGPSMYTLPGCYEFVPFNKG